jgi:hypothetical protein
MAHKGVVCEGFQIVALPAARDKARFLRLAFSRDHKLTILKESPAINSDRKVEGG